MKKYFIIIICLFFIVGCGTKLNNENNDKESSVVIPSDNSSEVVSEDNRNIAVMINNHSIARKNHAGLQEAKIIYELIVEGGITRYLAIFNQSSLDRVGCVRSARHYYLDYALENDAIYIHWGGSPQAYEDIESLNINNLDGIASSSPFYRDKSLNVALEHTSFVDLGKAMTYADEKKKYRTSTTDSGLLKYTNESITRTDGETGTDIAIKYSNTVTSSYKYDSENKVYNRYVNDVAHKDGVTKKQYTFKNIIIYSVKNDDITADDKGRQELYNIGTGTGKYCTEGLCYDINWSKSDRSSKTKYTYTDGSELIVNNGNTFIQIYPKSGNLTIN